MAPERPTQTQLSSVHYNAAPPVRPVSLRRCLHDQRRDHVSGLALGPASAQLCFLLPIYDLELNGPRNSSDLQKGLDARLPPGGKFSCHVTGSSIERLSVPPYTERDGGSQPAQYRVADVDVMLEIRPLSVALRPGDGAAIYMDASRSSHRGYTRVVAEPAAAQANPIFCRPVGDDGGPEIYLSIDTVNDALTALTTLFIPTATVHRQGPSVNVQQPGDIHHYGPLAYINDMDIVPALPLTERPPEFTDWLKRVRGRQWPPEELQQEMERDGRCFLVGAGHASSSRRDLEWRLSFSEPERRLALSLTPQQRKVYVLIKMMQKCYLQEPKVLVTYHIKTLMFWELEECSNTDWVEEELFEHVLAMLDRIEACLEQQYIPSYFMPDNNLISHADAGDVAAVLATVRQIRRRPLQHLYGIDDRFRFDFSSPRPLSELHEPLRRLLLDGGGGGEEAAEALTVSLIEQAQADVRRGLGEQRRCARLLRSAWEALAAAAPEGAPHPVHDDWLMFAAAAAFEAMGADESVWALQALEAVFDDRDRPGTLTQVPVEAAQALRQSLFSQSGDDTEKKSTGEYQLKLNEIVRSGLLEKPSPVSTVIHLRLAQLELLRDLKHKQLENIPDMPPLMASAIKTQIDLSNMDMTFKFKLSCGVPEHEALADLMQKLMAVTVGLLRDDEKRSVSTSVHSLATKTARELLRSEDMPDNVEDALRNDGDLAEQCQKLDERLKPAEKNPSRLPFDTDPRMLNYIPMHMTHLYQLAFTGGLSESELDHYYTPFFNMMGFFLKQKRLQYAFRTVGMLTCIWTTAPEWELHRVVYNVNRAPLYLQQLPEPARALLGLTSGRTTIGVLYRFIDLMHRTFVFEGVRIDDLLTGQLPHQQLEKMEATIVQTASLVDDDVELTHLVMRLCVLKVLGRDTDGGLADILAVN
ncbi:Protein MB21D2 [Amphibalanus amphitrite]|uniref:Protein MB21D2 n=1 Tax=Amphibalanus amphitrite TaxID=1232801 RepID=A0A6A4VEJ5_AMPAM|nr:Protein MB21D2 [Amphibalanus amphitrite]